MDDFAIRESFQEAYKTWNVKLPETLNDWGEFTGYTGWHFCYFNKVENGNLLWMDIKASHRMTSDRIERYYSDGSVIDPSHELLKVGFDDIYKDVTAIIALNNLQSAQELTSDIMQDMSYTAYTFFWKTESPFSQWFKTKFILNDVLYNSAEQFMMSKKAELFNDLDTQKKIMSTNDPRKQKELGRNVQNYVEAIWNEHKVKIVWIGNNLKFSQNPEILQTLLSTSLTWIVEASPNDKIWGIGLSESDENRFDKLKWQGENLLGNILTKLRDTYQSLQKYSAHNIGYPQAGSLT